MATSSSDDMKAAAINVLCPVTIQLLKEPSVQHAKALTKALEEIDVRVIQELQTYIIFPLEAGLRDKNVSESLLLNLCEASYTVFTKSRVLSIKIFYQLYTTILTILSKSRLQVPAKLSEESETALIKTIMLMLQASDENVLSEFYSINYIHILAQQITVLINIAKLDKSRELQKLALNCILQFMQEGTKYGEVNAVKLGDVFAHCLPGIVTGMVLVVTGSSNQGQAVFVKAISVCCRLLTLTLCDKWLQNSQEQIEQNKQKGKDPKDSVDAQLKSLYVERSQSWVKSTSNHLGPVIDAICGLVSNSHWRVRQTVVDFAQQLLMTCSSSLSDHVPKLLESLVGLIHDSYQAVAQKAMSALEAFKASQLGQPGQKTLTEILEENIFNLAASLPRLMKFCEEENKLHLIHLLQGYITLLGSNVSGFIHSSPHLKRLCLVLVQVLEMETTDVRVVEERGSLLHTVPEVFTESGSLHVWRPCKYFKHFRDDAVYKGLMNVCRLLGQYGNIYILVDHMLELYQESVVYKLAAVLAINEMVFGASLQDKEMGRIKDLQILKDVIKMLIDEYLSQSNLKLISDITACHKQSAPTSTSTSLVIVGRYDPFSQKEITIANRNRIILLTCLYMEGLGKFATALGKDFQVHLIRGLYPLVENLGHENLYLSSTAYSSLVEVALASGHSSLDQLIRDNADYLVTCVSQRLRHFDQHYRAPRTICVMLRYCSKELLYLISNNITQLFESLDDNYTHHLMLFMPVLLELVRAIGRWFPPVSSDKEKPSIQAEHSLDHQAVISCVTEYMKDKMTVHGYFTDADARDLSCKSHQERTLEDIEADMLQLQNEVKEKGDTEDMMEEEEEEPGKNEPPKHVQIVLEVFKRVRNLMLCKEPNLRVMALDVVCQSCQDLCDHERELLPQLHQLWPSLVSVFRQEEKFIIVKALKTLLILSKLSGDFMRLRIMKEIVPGISSYMEKQAKISFDSRSQYLYSSNYKLQLCVLSSLGELAHNLQLEGNDLSALVNICLPYLSDRQPQSLQQAALDSFYYFCLLEPDALWYTLNCTYSPTQLTPPGPEFAPFKFPVSTESKSFAKNITFLLEKYFS
ncbi:TELO2-interacting protein 1 homolog [Biomphalaria glabrata]|uniref:TELO2-interacting protein 1 homolog n=2 Tax=Biomphalaria glabrata TaxID=6526 RepID=A0A9W2YQC1_BIOGL|nr:TELO2-interacting protein 1 homolog [Biomphalaria glabrata]XP_055864820.1 TELO2-interacting protein 1 homolog [Biomphalaria glabrata]